MSGTIPFTSLGTSIRGKLGPARYRGAVFYVDEAGGTYGRRIVDHQYPARDVPFAEDLGREQRVWMLTGYTIGPAYRIQRDALLRACERKGPGTLFHPAIGAVQAVCRRVQWSERREAGGYCVFTLEFAEPGELLEPAGTPDSAQLLEVAADALGAATEAAFLSIFNVDDALSYVSDFAAIDVQATTIVLERMRKPANGYDQSAVTEALASLYDDAPQLVHAPPELTRQTQDCFQHFSNSGEPHPVGLSMLTFASDYTSGAEYVNTVAPIAPFVFAASGRRLSATPLHETTGDPPGFEQSSGAWLARNQAAWQRFARELALREFGYLTPAINFTSHQEAERVMVEMTAAFDAAETAAADANNDEVYVALIDLRGACMNDILARRGSLTPLVDYQMPRVTNAVTMAWRLYRDANRDLELVEMVDAYTPAFMPARGKVKAS